MSDATKPVIRIPNLTPAQQRVQMHWLEARVREKRIAEGKPVPIYVLASSAALESDPKDRG